MRTRRALLRLVPLAWLVPLVVACPSPARAQPALFGGSVGITDVADSHRAVGGSGAVRLTGGLYVTVDLRWSSHFDTLALRDYALRTKAVMEDRTIEFFVADSVLAAQQGATPVRLDYQSRAAMFEAVFGLRRYLRLTRAVHAFAESGGGVARVEPEVRFELDGRDVTMRAADPFYIPWLLSPPPVADTAPAVAVGGGVAVDLGPHARVGLRYRLVRVFADPSFGTAASHAGGFNASHLDVEFAYVFTR